MTTGRRVSKGKLEGGHGAKMRECGTAALFSKVLFDPEQPPASPRVPGVGCLQILVFVFEGAAARGDSVGGLFCFLALLCLQDLAEEREDGVETHPGRQLVSLCTYTNVSRVNKSVAYCEISARGHLNGTQSVFVHPANDV